MIIHFRIEATINEINVILNKVQSRSLVLQIDKLLRTVDCEQVVLHEVFGYPTKTQPSDRTAVQYPLSSKNLLTETFSADLPSPKNISHMICC